ncbi:phosphoribosylglycinamide formyltransferase [Arthrobacter crystallopoietes BAB-32]|uniref:Phosphoribosylglycinamide formyltransferase n=1 Tax=Arthrobacter crystallopoietes BAB-32 TaxID=1246476 RepID=N1UVH5_9MICC|nr:phosphoribosylglycinamide formyltransferase [Arthrobacter crystallopoietes]EMY33070.1 phosphoribosylglycinamide formyltransferase [Arthrobacter crystallopoietes BAB-32]
MRIVVLVSGSGTNLQAVIDAVKAGELDAEILAVGSDVPGCLGLERAEKAGIETFTCAPADFTSRPEWNRALQARVAEYASDLVLLAGFMRILDAEFVEAFEGRLVNTHPALLPSFPGAHGVRDALAHGVKITGVTVHLVDSGVDTGPILAQAAVPVLEDDTQESLHERIKVEERKLLVQTLNALSASIG